MIRESFVFYRSFAEALRDLDEITRVHCYDAITKYALDGETTELSGIESAVFKLIKPQIDANNKRFENGMKGGAPKGNKNNSTGKNQYSDKRTTKGQPKDNQRTTEPQPNVNVNVNVNDNVNVKGNVKEVKTAYGEYAHVKLTKTEYQKMISDFGQDKTDKAIKFFDEYIEDKGYKSKSHNLAMRRWVFKAVEEQEQKQGVTNGRRNNIDISAPNSRQRADYEEVDKLLWG
jgi:hypothetical protein